MGEKTGDLERASAERPRERLANRNVPALQAGRQSRCQSGSWSTAVVVGCNTAAPSTNRCWKPRWSFRSTPHRAPATRSCALARYAKSCRRVCRLPLTVFF